MAKVFIEETTLTNIGNAIRGKEGTTALIPVNDMATRILSLPEGGGGGYQPPESAFKFSGDTSYKFAGSGWNWFIEDFANNLTTENLSNLNNMFYQNTTITNIPFELNATNLEFMSNTFYNCYKLATCPKIRGTIKWSSNTNFNNILYNCYLLRDIEDLFEPSMLDGLSEYLVTGSYSSPQPIQFSGLHSLRQLPTWFSKFNINKSSTAFPAYSRTIYYNMLKDCKSLDEALDIPVWRCASYSSGNMFNSSFANCCRAKNITFETDNGTPYVVSWKSQTIDLSNGVGYNLSGQSAYNNLNAGISVSNLVNGDSAYQEKKDSPDWFAIVTNYSRYNHDSAVNTINSLPDTSAYLATAGGTNTIKFKGVAGASTDGGAINTLTEEEIAVATAKGWTVTLV